MNNKNAVIKSLNNVVAVQILFPCWSARKTLSPDDLGLQNESHAKEVISLGSKHTTNPQALKVFATLKRRAERLCKRIGVNFMGGYAIPYKKAEYVNEELSKIVAQFDIEKKKYLQSHEEIQAEWLETYPQYKEILAKEQLTVDQVEPRISATFTMFRLQPMEGEMSNGLGKQVEQLSDNLDADILKDVNQLLVSLNKAIKPSKQNVKGLKNLREKVEGLAFLNGKYRKLTDEIIKVEQGMGSTNLLSFEEQNKLSGLLYRMAEPERLNELMTQVNSSSTTKVEATDTPNNENHNANGNESIDDVFDDEDFDFGFGGSEKADPTTKSVFF